MPDVINRQPKDFPASNPPQDVTDPQGLGAASVEYPRHMHKWAGYADEAKKVPNLNDYIVVHNDKEKADALEDGWSLEPVTRAPGKAKKE